MRRHRRWAPTSSRHSLPPARTRARARPPRAIRRKVIREPRRPAIPSAPSFRSRRLIGRDDHGPALPLGRLVRGGGAGGRGRPGDAIRSGCGGRFPAGAGRGVGGSGGPFGSAPQARIGPTNRIRKVRFLRSGSGILRTRDSRRRFPRCRGIGRRFASFPAQPRITGGSNHALRLPGAYPLPPDRPQLRSFQCPRRPGGRLRHGPDSEGPDHPGGSRSGRRSLRFVGETPESSRRSPATRS